MKQKIQTRGVIHSVEIARGFAKGVSSTVETLVSGDRYSVSSSTVMHRYFNLKLEDGSERGVHLVNSDVAVTDGNQLVGVFGRKNGKPICLGVRNLTTGEVQANELALDLVTRSWEEWAESMYLVGAAFGLLGASFVFFVFLDFPFSKMVASVGWSGALSKLFDKTGFSIAFPTAAIGLPVMVVSKISSSRAERANEQFMARIQELLLETPQ